MINPGNLKLNLKAKVLLIPVTIITLTFLITAALLVKLTISNGYKTEVEGHNKQILTGLTLMSTSQLPADAYLALEGYDDELAQDLIKQINSLGIYDIFITDLNGQFLFAKDETEKIEFNAEFGPEFISMLNGAPKSKGFINTIYYSGHIVGYTPIVDVETSKGFLVFAVDITNDLVETAVLALGGIEDREDAAGLAAGNESEQNLLREMLIVLSLVMVPSLILILLLLGSTFRNIINPVNLLINAFKKLSNGDLTQEIEVKTKDEMKQLAVVFNMTIANLHDMVENVNNSSGSVAVSASQLSGSSKEINENAQNQTEKTAQSASAMEELNSSFEDVARNTANAAESAKEAAKLAVNGGEIMTKTVSGMNQISETVNYSANNVEALGKRSEEIGAIIEVINDIAGQTNLLALNAAIEAARAGEQGRGFAVVADEVRKLAERTTAATNEIGEMITGIQDDTGKAVESMKAGTKEVEEGVSLANQAGEALKNIVTSVQNVTDMMQHVATAAEQQSTTGQEISANIESVAEITKQTADAVRSSSESTTNLDHQAQELQQLVKGFNL